MTGKIKICGEGEIDRCAGEFLKLVGDKRVIAFRGEMGAGKTTFIAALCRRLGVREDDVSSPTFAIVNEYFSDVTGETLYHFDCYRIRDDAEALDMGIEDYFDSGRLCLIEWPDRIERFLPGDHLDVEIRVNPDDSRDIVIL